MQLLGNHALINQISETCFQLLEANTRYWRVVPYYDSPLRWQTEEPEFWKDLSSLSHEAIQALELNPFDSKSNAPHKYQALGAEIRRAVGDNSLSLIPFSELEPGRHHTLYRGIPGNKQRQIQHLSAALNTWNLPPHHRIIDWCGGKGHLGRVLGHEFNRPITIIEKNATLCHQGAEIQQKYPVACNVHYCNLDVHSPEVELSLDANDFAVALHACGQLNIRLAQLAAKLNLSGVAIVPCCYHRIAGDIYSPLSTNLQNQLKNSQELSQLTRQDLQLATTEQANPNARAMRTRKTWLQYRYALHLWRKLTDPDLKFEKLPRFHPGLIQQDFIPYGRSLEAKFNFELSSISRLQANEFLKLAAIEVQQRRAAALPRFLFRRCLELLLACDRANYLIENGFDVELAVLAPRSVTPRNLIILARNQR